MTKEKENKCLNLIITIAAENHLVAKAAKVMPVAGQAQQEIAQAEIEATLHPAHQKNKKKYLTNQA
jgi:hypothetical protein